MAATGMAAVAAAYLRRLQRVLGNDARVGPRIADLHLYAASCHPQLLLAVVQAAAAAAQTINLKS